MATPARSACANEGADRRSPCEKNGALECGNCRLVTYCSKECQKSHWPVHKKDCKSELLKSNWRPSWEREGRAPAFMTDDDINILSQVHFGWTKYLWGNVPALDIVNLEANEGKAYDKDMNLLFAASGDLRNVVRTVNSLPKGFSKLLRIDINDRDLDIVARNIIFLLLLYTIEDSEEAAECVLHLWYSALIPQACLQKLDTVADLIRDVCSKIKDKPAHALLGKTWTFAQGKGSLRVLLAKATWDSLLSYLKVPEGLTADRAEEARSMIMNAPHRIDFVHRRLFEQMDPKWRMCTHKFRQDGILLPFGQPRYQFTTPNPTFFQMADEWPIMDSADPQEGWPISEVLNTHTRAQGDVNGKLYQYVRSTLVDFHSRLRSSAMKFQFYHGDVEHVVPLLLDADMRYDRIEVSNICDRGYLGIHKTLSLFGPRLCSREQNPHATLVTLFINAVQECSSVMGGMGDLTRELKMVSEYLRPAGPFGTTDAEMMRVMAAKSMFHDVDKFFNRYMKLTGFREAEEAAGVKMKSKNSVVREWPQRLKLRPHQKGSKEEFQRLLGSGDTGMNRYVEWQRSSSNPGTFFSLDV